MIENKPHKIELWMFLIATFIAFIGLYYLGPSITGFVIKEFSYADELNLVVTSSGNYTWELKNIGALKSASIDGKVTNYGKARVYIESNGIRHLIFDSTRIESRDNATNLITGLVVKDDNGNANETEDEGKKKKNHKPNWKSDVSEFIINGTTLINLSQYFADANEDILVYSASEAEGLETAINNEIITIKPTKNESFNATIAFIASDGIDSKSNIVNLMVIFEKEEFTDSINITNATELNVSTNITNETAGIEANIIKTIAISLAYKNGTIYDANDNGEESANGVVDLSVESTSFNWNADESRLCTRWEIYNAEDGQLTELCSGNSDCCAFLELLPSKNSWNDVYYATFGKDNAGHDNIASAQVIYYDVNLSVENVKSEIYYSEWANKSVKFFEDEIIFFDECVDTCDLSGLNKSSYTLIFEIEDDAVLRIEKIKYDMLVDVANKAPLLLKNFSIINVTKNSYATIDLSQYFADPDGDMLSYDYYKVDGISILFDGSTATIVPSKGFEDTRITYIFANDSENVVSSNIFVINVIAAGIEVKFFEIRDNADRRLAAFDSLGNLNIKGVLMQNTEPIADEDDFGIQSPSLNAAITNPEGNVLIKGRLYEEQDALIPTPNSFIIQDERTNEIVAYISNDGSLFLKGILTENAFD